jgi:hypothetical protein
MDVCNNMDNVEDAPRFMPGFLFSLRLLLVEDAIITPNSSKPDRY